MNATAGGPLDGPTWGKNCQFQLTLFGPTRVFLFLEARNVKTDMRDVEGLQTEPDYPTLGFYVCQGLGDHVLLGPDEKPKVLYTCHAKRGDGVYLELGTLQPEPLKYVVIPFTATPNVEHSYALTLYTDLECDFVKIDPNKNLAPCVQCTDPRSFARVAKKLAALESKYATLMRKEARLKAANKFGLPRGGMPDQPAIAYAQPPAAAPYAYAPPPPPPPLAAPQYAYAPPPPQQQQQQQPPAPPPGGGGGSDTAVDRMFKAADVDGDGYVSMQDMENFRRYYQEVDTDADGKISADEIKRATTAMNAKGAEQQAAFDARNAALQGEIAAGAADLSRLLEAVRRAQEAKSAGAPPTSARGRKKR